MKTFVKDSDAVLDYEVDWSDWLAPLGNDTIVTSAWTVATGITKASDSHGTTTATIWLSGGTAGSSYEISNRITTAAGRTDDRTCLVIVRDR